jgi:hypothetical protein
MPPIDLDSLTIGQARELASRFGALAAPSPSLPPASPSHPFVGRYVILRCASAGVHAGKLVSQTGDQAILQDSRRLWQWKARAGVALSGLAVHGLHSGKIDTLVSEIALTGVIETIPCSPFSQASINDA